jgi:hypothetical protein
MDGGWVIGTIWQFGQYDSEAMPEILKLMISGLGKMRRERIGENGNEIAKSCGENGYEISKDENGNKIAKSWREEIIKGWIQLDGYIKWKCKTKKII